MSALGSDRRRAGVCACAALVLFSISIPEVAMGSDARRVEAIGLGGGGSIVAPAISPLDPDLMLVSCDMGGVYRSADGGQTWEMLHHRELKAYPACRPVFHPTDGNTVFAMSSGEGLKVSHDRGLTWKTVVGAPKEATFIAIDPGNPRLMLLGTPTGVQRSTDGAAHWQAGTGIEGPVLEIHVDQSSPVGTRVCVAATPTGILRSDDGGASWAAVATNLPKQRLLAFTGGSTASGCVLYCSVESVEASRQVTGGIYRSEDRGKTWVSAMGGGIDRSGWRFDAGPGTYQYEWLVTTSINPRIVYASCSCAGQVYRSEDAGATWRSALHRQPMNDPQFNVAPNFLIDENEGYVDSTSGLAINPADPNEVILADWMDCLITRDGGRQWQVGHTRSAEAPGRRGPGMRWANTGLVVTGAWHYYVAPFQANRHYIAYTDVSFARSIDAGKTWYWRYWLRTPPLRNTTYELAFDPEVPGRIWAAFSDMHDIPTDNIISGRHYWPTAGGGVGLSGDFGETWQDTSQGLPGKPIVSVVLDPRSPKGARTLYAAAFEGGVYKSTDDGKTWVQKSEGLGAPGTNLRACRIILHPDGTLFCVVTALRRDDRYVPEGPGLYRSRDGAEHWECITASNPLLWPTDFDVDPRDSNVIYLGAADARNTQGGLYKTSDGGAHWRRVARKSTETFGATVDPRRPDWVYMALSWLPANGGLWLSKDRGETWKAVEWVPFRNVTRIAFDPKDDSIIYVCTWGGSVWRGPAE